MLGVPKLGNPALKNLCVSIKIITVLLRLCFNNFSVSLEQLGFFLQIITDLNVLWYEFIEFIYENDDFNICNVLFSAVGLIIAILIPVAVAVIIGVVTSILCYRKREW